MREIPITKGEWRVSKGDYRITTSRPGILKGSETVANFEGIGLSFEEMVANSVVCVEAPEMLYILSEVQYALEHKQAIPEAIKGRLNEVLKRISNYRVFSG